ncbi:MAG: N-acetyl-alpha-D-glucosaminyl L-malate synthase BshA [Acidobacteria bacterium]|nr:N-acetyl-alpha-D-glucosaminyl L-malate synthase BshA [Acidobacteriota bacterium]
MNIGITCYPTYGGSGVVASELGQELAQRGHTVHFISYELPSRIVELNERVWFHEVEVVTYPLFDFPPYALALATTMVEIANSFHLDLIHVHYAIPHAISAFLAKSMMAPRRLPVMTTLHGTDITLVGNDKSYLPITRFGIEQSDCVTAVSRHLKEATVREFKTEKPIQVISNFVNLRQFRRIPPRKLQKRFSPGGEKVLVHISNFRPLKRIPDVIEIFHRVQKKIPARLLLIGDGPERSNADYLCRKLGISDSVFFLGKQASVREFLSVADLLLLPSELESFGLAALEGMACEVPVVASDAGGLPELIEDGKHGFLVGVGQTEEMAERALTILRDRDLRLKMGKACRARAQDYSSKKIVPLYEAAYQRLLEDHAAPAARPAPGSRNRLAGLPNKRTRCGARVAEASDPCGSVQTTVDLTRAKASQPMALKKKVQYAIRTLEAAYGIPARKPTDPLDELILTVLSQNTNDRNRDRAMERLRLRFPTWEAVRQAAHSRIAHAIRVGGLSNIKGRRIKQILNVIHERCGSLDLSFLHDLPLEEAREFLHSLNGVGPKTVACVLLFACGKPAFPVDTHIGRITRRLGWLPVRANDRVAHARMEALVPPERYLSLHVNLIEHGRTVCRPRNPRCSECCIRAVCAFPVRKNL